jgi:hypothetical protein
LEWAKPKERCPEEVEAMNEVEVQLGERMARGEMVHKLEADAVFDYQVHI